MFEAPSIEGYPRQVFVLTDGEVIQGHAVVACCTDFNCVCRVCMQVSNADQVIALTSKHASSTRVFTFGIGSSVSRHLVEVLFYIRLGARVVA